MLRLAEFCLGVVSDLGFERAYRLRWRGSFRHYSPHTLASYYQPEALCEVALGKLRERETMVRRRQKKKVHAYSGTAKERLIAYLQGML